MSDFDVREKSFEQILKKYTLTYGGYQKVNPCLNQEE